MDVAHQSAVSSSGCKGQCLHSAQQLAVSVEQLRCSTALCLCTHMQLLLVWSVCGGAHHCADVPVHTVCDTRLDIEVAKKQQQQNAEKMAADTCTVRDSHLSVSDAWCYSSNSQVSSLVAC
jgi:hypothetical protein